MIQILFPRFYSESYGQKGSRLATIWTPMDDCSPDCLGLRGEVYGDRAYVLTPPVIPQGEE